MTSYKEPLVRITGGNRLITTSLAVSQHFEKKHKNVLQAIDELDCSQEFARLNFQPCSYQDDNKRPRPMYEITRDGFMFLCMGFTGARAAQWKEKYIVAFNTLEKSLHLQQGDVATLQEQVQQLQQQLLSVAKPSWKQIKRYKHMGLTQKEIAKLLDKSGAWVSLQIRDMRACGLLPSKKRAKQLTLELQA